MAAARPPPQGPNMDVFEAFFKRADLGQDGRISRSEAVAFFQGSNLPKHVLAQENLRYRLLFIKQELCEKLTEFGLVHGKPKKSAAMEAGSICYVKLEKKELFKEHNDLILGLNDFMLNEHHIRALLREEMESNLGGGY